MPSGTQRIVVAIGGASAILIGVFWVQSTVFPELVRQAQNLQITLVGWGWSLAYVMIAAGVLAVSALAVWARSLIVGTAFVVVGAFWCLQPLLFYRFPRDDVLEPLQAIVSRVAFSSGSLPAVYMVGAGLLLAGLLSIGLAVRGRVTAAGATPRPSPTIPAPDVRP